MNSETSMSSDTAAGAIQARPVLRQRLFMSLLSGQTISTAGDQIYLVALPILILAHYGTASELGLVLSSFGIARTATFAIGGWLVDQLGPIRIMFVCDAERLVAMAGLATLAADRRSSFWEFALAAVLLGMGEGCFSPASFSVLPEVVHRESLQAANAVFQGSMQAAAILGPALGGVIVATFSPSSALFIDSATFLVSAVSLMAIWRSHRNLRSRPAADRKPSRDTPDGSSTFWSVLKASPLLRTMLGIAAAASLAFGGALQVGLPALVKGPLAQGAGGYGLLLTGFGVGGFLGSLAATRWGRFRTGPVAVVGISLLGCGLLGLVISSELPQPLAMGMAFVVAVTAGGGLSLGNTLLLTLFQRSLPTQVIGRVMSAMLFANFGLYPVSTFLAGAIITSWGSRVYLGAAGIFLLTCTLSSFLATSVRHATLT